MNAEMTTPLKHSEMRPTYNCVKHCCDASIGAAASKRWRICQQLGALATTTRKEHVVQESQEAAGLSDLHTLLHAWLY